jgi:hypothetical protein
MVLLTNVRKGLERNHPVVLILDADTLDVDAVQVSPRLSGAGFFTPRNVSNNLAPN